MDKQSRNLRQKLVSKINRKSLQNLKIILVLAVAFGLLFSVFGQCYKTLPITEFHYPCLININNFVEAYKQNISHNLPLRRVEYNFLSNPKSLCSIRHKMIRKRIFLIFLVKSKTENFEKRNAIRQTWANGITLTSNSAKRVFLVGNSKDATINKNLDKEIKYNDDILLINYNDDYNNNTIKTVGGLRWLYNFCDNIDFVIFVDDDYFIATNSLLTFLKTQNRKSKLFMGYEYPSSGPFRFRFSKWYVSFSDYEFDTYPRYISGGAVIMTKEMATSLYIASKLIKQFKIDDVYLGIIAHQLSIKPQHNKNIYVDKITHTNPNFKTLLASHGYEVDEMYKAWACHQQNICNFSDSKFTSVVNVSSLIILILIFILIRYASIVRLRYFGRVYSVLYTVIS